MPTQTTSPEVIDPGEALFAEKLELAEKISLRKEEIAVMEQENNNDSLRIKEIDSEAAKLARPEELAEVKDLPALPVGEPAPQRGVLMDSADANGTRIAIRVDGAAANAMPDKKRIAEAFALLNDEQRATAKQGWSYMHHLKLN